VLLPPSEIEHRAPCSLYVGIFVRNYFLGAGHSLADCGSHPLKYALHDLGLRGDVLVHGLEVVLAIVSSRFQFSGFSALGR